MRKFLSILLVLFATVGILAQDAEARRFGGGRSFGISRSTSSFARPSSAMTQNRPSMNKWMGPLAGLAIGGLLASLFMSNGIGSGILSWLLVGGLFLILFSFLRNRMQPKPSYQRDDYRNQQFTQKNEAFEQPRYSNAQNYNSYPSGFDAPSFLREAKSQFIRMQAAYDQKNMNDIREFTTPEVFAEIRLQFDERGIAENKTDVISLEAVLLDVENEMQGMIATVRFNGMIQEDKELPAEAINEIWHFKKEVNNLRWLVAGVQQS